MTPLYDLIGRAVVALAFGPVDRTARRFERFYAEELAAVERTP